MFINETRTSNDQFRFVLLRAMEYCGFIVSCNVILTDYSSCDGTQEFLLILSHISIHRCVCAFTAAPFHSENTQINIDFVLYLSIRFVSNILSFYLHREEREWIMWQQE